MNEIEIRHTLQEDRQYLVKWLQEPGILRWFPMHDDREIDDAVNLWMGYISQGAVFTALYKGVPCGMSILYLQQYKKIAHHALFAIIVDKDYRQKGIGTCLIQEMIKRGKEQFHLEILHLEVYEGNPAILLYEKLGFVRYGNQKHFIKDQGTYLGKIFMQKNL
ncbi:MAG: GNAT family N-acetyltransferase [Chlamydiota bacterium]